MADPRIAEDTILYTERLINEALDMKEAADQALADVWGDFREGLKSLGLKGSEVSKEVADFKGAIVERRMSEADKAKAMSKAEGVESYHAILDAPRARARERAA